MANLLSTSSFHGLPGPETVPPFNLPTAIREYIDKIKLQQNIKIRFTCVPKKMYVEQDLQLSLYRIMQEQIDTILRHSEANTVAIKLQNQKKKITLSVTDDGKGCLLKLAIPFSKNRLTFH